LLPDRVVAALREEEMRLRRLLLILMVCMAGCAVQPADLGWTHDAPDFRFQRLEWNVVESRRHMTALCAMPSSWAGQACAIRIRESGLCVVFSTMTEEEAKRTPIWNEGWSLHAHEMAHCNGWGHSK
jgi:hypothetical protein